MFSYDYTYTIGYHMRSNQWIVIAIEDEASLLATLPMSYLKKYLNIDDDQFEYILSMLMANYGGFLHSTEHYKEIRFKKKSKVLEALIYFKSLSTLRLLSEGANV